MNFSYWESEAFLKNIHFLVVGSGIVGLSTAIHLKRKNPKSRIVVVDRDVFSAGGSTKNAGFACFGSPTEIFDDLSKMSKEEVFGLVQRRYHGLHYLRSLLGDDELDYRPVGGQEIFTTVERPIFHQMADQLGELNEDIFHAIGIRPYSVYSKLPEHWNFGGVEHAILNNAEGSIDTGKMMRAFLRLAQQEGVEIWNGMNVLSISEIGKTVEVRCDHGVFEVEKVVVCTNAFARQLFPEVSVQPVRNQVIVTEPLPHLTWEGTFHMDRGYRYFRRVGERVLLGGFRNFDADTETTDQFGITEKIQGLLEQFLQEVIFNGKAVRVDYRWSGILGMGDQKTTIVKRHSEHIAMAVRMGGMGVAIGSLVGKEAAELFD
jgi:glycine/D-amino acid oxidase-like deaminating enzyme